MSQVAIVTGASRGIGFSIAKRFLEKGFSVGICGRSSERLAQAMRDLADFGDAVFAMPADLSEEKNCLDFGAAVLDKFGKVDALINNAGGFVPGNIHEMPLEDVESQIRVNFYSALCLSQKIIPQMKERGSGFIANISSVAGLQAYPGGGAYSVSKFALTGFTKALRLELAEFGIRVCGVYPGAVLTDSWSGTELPEARFIKAEDIAKVVWNTYDLSAQANVEDIVIRPSLGDI